MTSGDTISAVFLLVLAIVLTLLISASIGGVVKGKPKLLCQGLGSLLLIGTGAYLVCQGKPPVFVTASLLLGWVMGMGDVMWVRATGSPTPLALKAHRR